MSCFILRITNNKKQFFLLALNDRTMEFKCHLYDFQSNKQIQSSSERSLATKSRKQVSIRSEIHNIWRSLSLLLKHWKKININRLNNTGIDTPRAKARSLYYLYIHWCNHIFQVETVQVGGGRWWSVVEVVGGRWRRLVAEVGGGSRR